MVLNLSWVAFSGYLVEQYLNRGDINVINYVVDDNEEHDLEKIMMKLIEGSRAISNRYCKMSAWLYNAFAFLLDNFNEKAESNTCPSEYYLLKALDFIDIYYHENITVERIATHIGIIRKYPGDVQRMIQNGI